MMRTFTVVVRLAHLADADARPITLGRRWGACTDT